MLANVGITSTPYGLILRKRELVREIERQRLREREIEAQPSKQNATA
jgi:hypothetical protein